jgi:hypothetical protein
VNAADLLDKYRRKGVEINASGDRLGYKAPVRVLTPADKAELAAHKPELLRLLTADKSGAGRWTLADIFDGWSERAAILEYEVGLSRADAEREAWRLVMFESRIH